MVITGAASGIMEAGHVGAGRENSIGVNILLPFEQEANSDHRRRPQADAPEILLHAQAAVREGVRRRRPVPRRLRHAGRGLRGADAGADRQEPAFPDRHGGRTGRRLLEAVAAVHHGRAAAARPDLAGRPGAVQGDRFGRRGGRRGAGLLPRLPQHALRRRRPGAAAADGRCREPLLERIRTEFADIVDGGHVRADDGAAGRGQRRRTWPTCRGCASASTAAAWAGCGC